MRSRTLICGHTGQCCQLREHQGNELPRCVHKYVLRGFFQSWCLWTQSSPWPRQPTHQWGEGRWNMKGEAQAWRMGIASTLSLRKITPDCLRIKTTPSNLAQPCLILWWLPPLKETVLSHFSWTLIYPKKYVLKAYYVLEAGSRKKAAKLLW